MFGCIVLTEIAEDLYSLEADQIVLKAYTLGLFVHVVQCDKTVVAYFVHACAIISA